MPAILLWGWRYQKEGMVAIDGWATVTEHHVAEFGAANIADDGVDSIIYTDIGRDGLMSGVNIEATVSWPKPWAYR